ncbi:MAG TPA: outer membrane lipoprotein carrier protein LolA [Nitrospirota bacterium]|nr:outer membrane lipoprotein carrier protein LolA [Nitrospirota bacterium]
MTRHCKGILIKLIIILITVVTNVTSSAAGSAELSAHHPLTMEEAVSAIEKHYQELTDLTARVSQKNFLKTLGRTQEYEGMLWIKIPGKLRLEYTNGQLILISGKDALFYSKKSEQVIKKNFSDFAQMNIPVAFLLGAAHIHDDFDIRQPDPKSLNTFELLPRKAGAAMKKLEIQSDEIGRIKLIKIFDKFGNITEMLLTDIKEGIGIDDHLFVFKAPKGVEVIEQ